MSTALVVIDMLNPYRHADAGVLQDGVAEMVGPLADLVARAVRDGTPVIYVNDNHGDFSATRDDLVAAALRGERPDLVKPVLPPDDCAFLPKVRHSAFFGTPLEYILHQLGVREVVLTGQVTEQCVLYTALDAYIRHLEIKVPRDAVASIDPGLGDAALRMMERNMRADLVTADACLR
ncbi:Vibriobactin-specific isochorismatase [Actinomadura rubteroloni]|uniref:Vibriobactin-specific isochorismatase n=1 Tax=Actinomadura rubteroloni TaxID=1926885 RepID=A0A2P4UMG9_9ACTN|nr:isochorismatase family cysteine hydrolase [Actinomadura rubteroloni]POM26199.1 Vibriobactin-specific isochorismatase [Actinomadura rubteroloni]